MATVLPFHRAVLDEPAFTAADGSFAVHTRWIETEFDNTLPPYDPASLAIPAESGGRQEIVAEVNGRRVTVTLPAELAVRANGAAPTRRSSSKRASAHHSPEGGGDALVAPMQGTVVKVAVKVGDPVAPGDVVAVVEAMKMENPVPAHKAGVVKSIQVEVGGSVTAGAVVAEIADAPTES